MGHVVPIVGWSPYIYLCVITAKACGKTSTHADGYGGLGRQNHCSGCGWTPLPRSFDRNCFDGPAVLISAESLNSQVNMIPCWIGNGGCEILELSGKTKKSNESAVAPPVYVTITLNDRKRQQIDSQTHFFVFLFDGSVCFLHRTHLHLTISKLCASDTLVCLLLNRWSRKVLKIGKIPPPPPPPVQFAKLFHFA